tara:strand:- start:5182 stop:5787 length:606 start_codon:yes stop_codon:yes gene_type:complete
MSQIFQTEARRAESITIRSGSDDGDIDVTIFPNRVQIGLDADDFNNVNVVSGSLKVTESINGKILHFTHHNFTIASTSVNYVPINSATESTTRTDEQIGFQVPYDGQLKKVMTKVNVAWGSTLLHHTTIAFHKGPDGTESVSASATESETVALTTANTTKTVSFSSSTFSAGDTVAVSIDPYASTSGKVRMTCVWEYDTNT